MGTFDQELDTSGLHCPLPMLRTKKAFNALDAGKGLKIVATDEFLIRQH